MSGSANDASFVMGGADGETFPLGPDRLAGTGTTEDSTASLMTNGRFATLLAGDTAIRFTLRGTVGVAGQVATTDRILAANQRFDWTVTDGTAGVYVEAADGSSAYEAWVWQSSPGVA